MVSRNSYMFWHSGAKTCRSWYLPWIVFCWVHLLVTILSTCAVAVLLQTKKEIQCTGWRDFWQVCWYAAAVCWLKTSSGSYNSEWLGPAHHLWLQDALWRVQILLNLKSDQRNWNGASCSWHSSGMASQSVLRPIHTACCSPALLRQCCVPRESPCGNRKYPNC